VASISEITKRIALGCIPLAALIILTPKPQASAQFDIFTAVLGTVTGMGDTIKQFNTDTAEIQNLQTQILYPVQEFNNIQSNATSVVNSYRGWMNSVFGLNLASAQTTSGQALERQMLSGFTNTNPSAQMGSLFTNAYGSLPNPSQATQTHVQAIDAGDASAQAAMQMSVMADASAASTVQLANSLESQALTTSPGSAPQLEAQALASELNSMAIEHKLLATQLRAEATRLGYRGAEFKQGAISSGTAVQGIFGGAK
jgi:hypothetical protein